MFDCHMHTTVSYDGHSTPAEMVQAAAVAGLKEICFTEHLDYMLSSPRDALAFRVEDYNRAFAGLAEPNLKIRFGAEVGMTPWNVETVNRDLSARHYDFVIGSVHIVDDLDMYFPPYWEGKTVRQGEQRYLEELLACVQHHDNFDVLGHLTYISKVRAHPAPRLVPLDTYQDIVTQIMKVLIDKGKGMEVNTSGLDRVGDFLPGREYLQLFKDLGGEIITVGSDAHSADRVGQYTDRACALVKEIFGYVCTFEDRKPIFHKL